jgi:Glycosyl transferase family 2
MGSLSVRTPVRQFLAYLEERLGSPAGELAVDPPAIGAADEGRPFLSVLLRTQGRRDANLLEALTSLAAQMDEDFEVLLLVHSDDPTTREAAAELVSGFDTDFAERVRVIGVSDGGRSRPLNVGIEEAAGSYLAFLDDDDLAKERWVEAFKEGAAEAPGAVIRSIAVDMKIRPSNGARAPYVTIGGLEAEHASTFDLSEHLYTNRTPLCSFAVPRAAVELMRVRFDESLPVLEDWDFLLRVSTLVGVHDTSEVTSVYHRWIDGESALSTVSETDWMRTREKIQRQLDSTPLLFPTGSATSLSALGERIHALETELDQTRHQVHDALRERNALWAEKEQQQVALQHLANLEAAYIGMSNSLSWRITRPLRTLKRLIR